MAAARLAAWRAASAFSAIARGLHLARSRCRHLAAARWHPYLTSPPRKSARIASLAINRRKSSFGGSSAGCRNVGSGPQRTTAPLKQSARRLAHRWRRHREWQMAAGGRAASASPNLRRSICGCMHSGGGASRTQICRRCEAGQPRPLARLVRRQAASEQMKSHKTAAENRRNRQ